MKQTKRSTPRRRDTATVPLDATHSVTVARTERGALVRVSASDRALLDVEIALTPDGPVLRARAMALELDAARGLNARCEDFRVEARGEVAITAGGAARIEGHRADVIARRGNVTLKANDDVQCLGEQILLNCDRTPPVPAWVPTVASPLQAETVTVARASESGDTSLFDTLDRTER